MALVQQEISKSKKIIIFLILFFLNIGFRGLFPDDSATDTIAIEIFCLTILSTFVVLFYSKSRDYINVFVYALVFYFYLIISSSFGDPAYGFTKAYVGLIVPFSLVAFLGVYKWTEDEVLQCLSFCVILICLVALVYKVRAGFFDRSVNYGLLGPIPFGWMSGIGFFSVALKKKRSFIHIFLAIFFFLMIIWSGSKGPFIGVVVIFVLRFNSILGRKLYVKVLTLVLLILGVYLLFTFGQNTRIVSSIQSYIEDPEGYSEGVGEGSFGAREANYSRSIQLFQENPVAGVGFGAYALGTNEYNKYPHNIIFEISSETGLIGIFFFIIFLFKVYRRNTVIWIGCYGLLTLMFSGDFSYIRYSLFPVLLGFYIKSDANKT